MKIAQNLRSMASIMERKASEEGNGGVHRDMRRSLPFVAVLDKVLSIVNTDRILDLSSEMEKHNLVGGRFPDGMITDLKGIANSLSTIQTASGVVRGLVEAMATSEARSRWFWETVCQSGSRTCNRLADILENAEATPTIPGVVLECVYENAVRAAEEHAARMRGYAIEDHEKEFGKLGQDETICPEKHPELHRRWASIDKKLEDKKAELKKKFVDAYVAST